MENYKPVTVITGASGGIGEYLAYEFAAMGEDLLLVARSADKLQTIAAKIETQYSVNTSFLALDLSEATAGEQLAEHLKQNEMQVRHLVNNAGFGLNGPMQKLDRLEQLNMIDLNVRSLTDLSLRFLDEVAANEGGILNVASTISFMAAPYMGVYGASKAYVLSFTEALSGEMKDRNVKISAVCPGPTATGFGARSHMDRSDLFDHVPTMSAKDVAKIAFRDYMRRKTVIVTGISNKPLPYIIRLAPRWLTRLIVGKLMNTEK
ncbi:MAG: SDR family oxidoreductase [Rhizobiales bacterium]|nr:SDR family oxidoreductase [Hyphomicrobiales bacterium]